MTVRESKAVVFGATLVATQMCDVRQQMGQKVALHANTLVYEIIQSAIYDDAPVDGSLLRVERPEGLEDLQLTVAMMPLLRED